MTPQGITCAAAGLITALTIVASPGALAETAILGTNIALGSKIFQYIVAPPQLETMYIQGRRQDIALHLQVDCKAEMQVRPKQMILLDTIDLPDDRSNPVKGSWQVRYDLVRCGETKLYDVVLVADPAGGKPTVAAHFPGDSIAGLRLVRDAIAQTAALANGKAGDAACKRVEQVIVADMRVVERPHRVVDGDHVYENVWNERWTFDVCGRPIVAMMRFVPTPRDGGTDWHASFPNEPNPTP